MEAMSPASGTKPSFYSLTVWSSCYFGHKWIPTSVIGYLYVDLREKKSLMLVESPTPHYYIPLGWTMLMRVKFDLIGQISRAWCNWFRILIVIEWSQTNKRWQIILEPKWIILRTASVFKLAWHSGNLSKNVHHVSFQYNLKKILWRKLHNQDQVKKNTISTQL